MELVKKIKSNPKVVVFVFLFVVALSGIALSFLTGPEKLNEAEMTVLEPPASNIEIFSLAAVISEIDIQRKLITVKHPTKDRDINVIVKDSSEIFKVEFPFDPKNPPSQASFAPKYTKIALQDLRPGNHALIESSENIYNKYEFDDVKSIQVLP
ncbi:MAG: hypothetical protein A2117_00570 [Candidatus Wildermuthbacteria bacterium GWA2_46_15]|uniref:Uncharacterized protein n=1 Tax=Candidatus Wildermuthbacteria bacterium GWA2_46_15 TaxID=1802443 RepID=A0A1G2QQ45_9BACT|nr:MAG: hypothetical protein A2117_00570 [Candidatus Wildermuthbacteria bacterium GWA2_46_15]